MSIVLRPYQDDLLNAAREKLRSGTKSLVLHLATGGGKTAIAATIFKAATAKGKRCWFINHRREILAQSAETFRRVGVAFGYVAAGFVMDRTQLAQVISIDTLRHRLQMMPPPDLVVWDEGHHIGAATWGSIMESIPDATHIALTATPQRLDGRGLGKWFSAMVSGPSVAWLIENGFLSDYRLFAPGAPSMKGVHSRGGDYVTAEAAGVMDKPIITGHAVNHYRKHAAGKRALVRCVSIAHSIHVAEQFRIAGFNAIHLDGKTPMHERVAAMARFRSGDVQIISNCSLFDEGLDIPGIECGIDLRPTQSLTLWLQFCGRALRKADGKTEAILLDAAGNAFRHGLPDQEHEWSLDGARDSKRNGQTPRVAIKSCDRCFAVVPQHALVCRHCGHEFLAMGRDIEQRDGELIEITPEQREAQRIALRKEQGQATSIEQLVRIGMNRNYKKPHAWARFVMGARQGKTRRAA